MAGFDNDQVFGETLSLTRTSSGNFQLMTDGTDTFGIYNNAGTPENVVAADIGSLCCDTTNGLLYRKTTDTVTTGWVLVGGGITSLTGESGSKVTNSGGGAFVVRSPDYLDVNGTGTSLVNTGEFVTGAYTRTLPTTAGLVDGDLVEFICTSSSILTITANTGQTIRLGNTVSA